MFDEIYLDCNATAPLSPKVAEYVQTQMVRDWANPSSEHDAGYTLSLEIKRCRREISEFLGCTTGQITFTSGATESINTVLNPDNLQYLGIDTIITSPMEHHATLDRVKYLQSRGFKVEMVKTLPTGSLDYEDLERLSSQREGSLISLLFVNNETGIINDVKKISAISRKYSCLTHIDSVQALGKLRFLLEDLDIDFASFSGHKIGALKGVGLLFHKHRKFKPLLHGGGQEKGLRAGTYNPPAIKSLALAISDIDIDKVEKEGHYLRQTFENTLRKHFPDLVVNGQDCKRVYSTINCAFPGRSGKEVMLGLSRYKIFVSTGSACSSGTPGGSHVLNEFTTFHNNSIRVSFTLNCLEILFKLDNLLVEFSKNEVN